MWSERAPQELVMGKVFPRATGLAEVLWSGPEVTLAEGSYDRFLMRLDSLGSRWELMNLKPGLEGVPVDVEVAPGEHQGTVEVTVLPALRNVGGTVRFVPVEHGDKAHEMLTVVGEEIAVKGKGVVNVDVTLRGRTTGVTESFPVAGHAAAHKPLILSYDPSIYYTGGGLGALVDGRRGASSASARRWR